MIAKIEGITKASYFTVDTAIGGKEALHKHRQNEYDVVLTDLEMPKMDGYSLTGEIRRLESEAEKPIVILAISASDCDLNHERAKRLGFDGCMLKPLDVDVLQAKLAAIFCDEAE